MKIIAAIKYISILRFFKNALSLPIEERRIKKRTIKRFLVYDPRIVTCRHVEKEAVTSAMYEPRMDPPHRTSDIINIQQEE